MSFVLVLTLVLVGWSVVACVVGFVVGGAARLRDEHSSPPGPGLTRSAVRRAA